MIRTKMMTLIAVGVLTVTGISAMAATKTSHRQMKAAVAAPAEGAPVSGSDAAKPAQPKKGKRSHKAKDKAPATDSAPAPTTEAK